MLSKSSLSRAKTDRDSIVLVHGLGSHPYWAWVFDANPVGRDSNGSVPLFADSTLSLPLSLFRLHQTLEHGASPSVSESPVHTELFSRHGTFWPRDLLPADMPRARICTIGYRSKWTSSKFETSFKECGEQLLAVLSQDRQAQSVRMETALNTEVVLTVANVHSDREAANCLHST